MSTFIRHDPCPRCGSSDALAVYSDHETCFSEGCGYYKQYNNNKESRVSEPKEAKDRNLIPLPSHKMKDLDIRGLDASSLNKYQVTTDYGDAAEAIFPRFDQDGEHCANQIRLENKQFRVQGTIKGAQLFGQSLFPAGGRSITITEGYYDTLAAYQLTGERYPNVGVMAATFAKREVVDNFEYLDSFEQIVINFDSDEPGQRAAKTVAQLFTPGKVRILKLASGKDANEYLMAGKYKEYVNEWFRAPSFMPDGLKLGTDQELLDEIIDYREPESIPYPWEGLNNKLYGIRLSELTLFTADTGIGKTTFMKEIEYALLQNRELQERGYGVGFLHLEEPKRETLLGMLSIHNNKPYHLPDTDKSPDEIKDAYNAVLNNNRVVVYDHFGSNDIDIILAKIRHMVALGCRYIVLDHLSIIVSDHAGDERKQLDEISTKLKTLTMNLQIAVIAVIHINRQGAVRGSAGPEQVSNNVIRLVRDKKAVDEWRRNITRMEVEKCRLSGRTGPASWVFYDGETGRLSELPPDLVQVYEEGGSTAGNEFAMYDNARERV